MITGSDQVVAHPVRDPLAQADTPVALVGASALVWLSWNKLARTRLFSRVDASLPGEFLRVFMNVRMPDEDLEIGDVDYRGDEFHPLSPPPRTLCRPACGLSPLLVRRRGPVPLRARRSVMRW